MNLRKGSGVSPQKPAPRNNHFRENQVHLLAGLAICVLTLLAFSNSFHGGFILDNRALLLNDPRLRDATADNLHLIWTHTYWWPIGEGGVFRPFTTLSYLFNYSILGNRDQPSGYHWVNFLLHVGNSLLVYALSLRLFRKARPSFFIAATWAVHPILTESVTNMVGRADLLAAGGLLAGFLLYLKSVEANGLRRFLCLTGLMLATAIGVFSKENATIIPFGIILCELIFRKPGSRRRLVVGVLATLAPIALMFYQRSVVLAASLPKEVPFVDNPILGADFWTGRLTAVKVLARYFSLILWPARLSVDYSWSAIPFTHGTLHDWVAWIAVLCIIPGMVFLFRWNRNAFVLSCFALSWLAPVSNLLFPIGTIMAERFLYLPALAFVVCAVLGFDALAERASLRAWAPVALSLLIAVLTARTFARNAEWKDELTMAKASVDTSPNSYKTHDLLANALFASDAAHSNIARVLEESEKSLAILDPLPDSRNAPDVYRFAGTCYLYQGDLLRAEAPQGSLPPESLRTYGKAITALLRFLAIEKTEFSEFKGKLNSEGVSTESPERMTAGRQSDAYTLLYAAFLRTGDTNRALDAAAQARALNPLSPEVYRRLAEIARSVGRMDDAAATLVEGAFIASDSSLREALVKLYQEEMDPRSCALIPGPRGPAINPACAIVHAHLCAASVDTIRTLVQAGKREAAETRKEMFVHEFGCANSPLDEALR